MVPSAIAGVGACKGDRQGGEPADRLRAALGAGSGGAGSLPASELWTGTREPPSWVTAAGTCDQVLAPWVLGTCRSGLAAPGTTVGGEHTGEARKTFHNFIRRKRETHRGAPAPPGPSGNQTKWLFFCVLRPHV